MIETSGGDTEMVDGYDELPEEYQEKIDYALANGHVPDEDWKGVSRATNPRKIPCPYANLCIGPRG